MWAGARIVSATKEFTLGPEAVIGPETAMDGEGEALAPRRTGLVQAIGTRNLLIVIVTMPLVFLIVVMATIAIFGNPDDRDEGAPVDAGKAETSPQAPRHASGAVASIERLEQPGNDRARLAKGAALSASAVSLDTFVADPAPIILPKNVKPTAIALDGDRIALHIEGPDGGAIVLYDAVNGRVLQQIAIQNSDITATEPVNGGGLVVRAEGLDLPKPAPSLNPRR